MLEEFTEQGFWQVLLGGGAGAALTAAGAWSLKYLPMRSKIKREERADALAEYQRITERYQTELVQLRTDLQSAVDLRWKCEIEQEHLRGEIKILTNSVQRLQAKVGDETPPTTLPTLVIAGLDGMIRHCSPSVAPMFHYMPQEVVGKSIKMLMPARYVPVHEAALASLKSSGAVPWTDKVLLGHGLTKDGREFPVAVSLSAWQDNDSYTIAAEIRLRPSAVDPAEIEKLHEYSHGEAHKIRSGVQTLQSQVDLLAIRKKKEEESSR